MRFVPALFLCLLTLSAPFSVIFSAWAGPAAYFSALPDLPVAPGLAEEADSAVHFDQPEGRIIVLQAIGQSKVDDIKQFYSKTLPALGWKMLKPGRYVRNNEVLLLNVKQPPKGPVRLRILLRPR